MELDSPFMVHVIYDISLSSATNDDNKDYSRTYQDIHYLYN